MCMQERALANVGKVFPLAWHLPNTNSVHFRKIDFYAKPYLSVHLCSTMRFYQMLHKNNFNLHTQTQTLASMAQINPISKNYKIERYFKKKKKMKNG